MFLKLLILTTILGSSLTLANAHLEKYDEHGKEFKDFTNTFAERAKNIVDFKLNLAKTAVDGVGGLVKTAIETKKEFVDRAKEKFSLAFDKKKNQDKNHNVGPATGTLVIQSQPGNIVPGVNAGFSIKTETVKPPQPLTTLCLCDFVAKCCSCPDPQNPLQYITVLISTNVQPATPENNQFIKVTTPQTSTIPTDSNNQNQSPSYQLSSGSYYQPSNNQNQSPSYQLSSGSYYQPSNNQNQSPSYQLPSGSYYQPSYTLESNNYYNPSQFVPGPPSYVGSNNPYVHPSNNLAGTSNQYVPVQPTEPNKYYNFYPSTYVPSNAASNNLYGSQPSNTPIVSNYYNTPAQPTGYNTFYNPYVPAFQPNSFLVSVHPTQPGYHTDASQLSGPQPTNNPSEQVSQLQRSQQPLDNGPPAGAPNQSSNSPQQTQEFPEQPESHQLKVNVNGQQLQSFTSAGTQTTNGQPQPEQPQPFNSNQGLNIVANNQFQQPQQPPQTQ